MSGRRRVLAFGAIVVALVLVAAWFVPRQMERAKVERAVSAYDAALTDALGQLDPDRLGETAGDREKLRVTNYVTFLWGNGIYVEAHLESLKVEQVRSSADTITAEVTERWRFQDRQRSGGAARGPVRAQEQRMRYTLKRRVGGELYVELAELIEEREADE